MFESFVGGETNNNNNNSNNNNHYQQAIKYALELASALEYLHERKLVFRDVKPQNVGLLSTGPKCQERVQLFDFGLCRPLTQSSSSNSSSFASSAAAAEEEKEKKNISDNTSCGVVDDDENDATYPMSMAGTVRYMSPEMQQGEPYNCKTDVYSFAITFCEMLSLEKPFGEILRSRLFREYVCLMGKRPALPSAEDLPSTSLSDSLQQLLQQAWCDSIPNRLSMRQVKEKLQKILEENQ